MRRLLLLSHGREIESQVKRFAHLGTLEIYASTLKHRTGLRTQLAELLADRALFREGSLPRSAEAFAAAVRAAKRNLGIVAAEISRVVTPLLEYYHIARAELDDAKAPGWRDAVRDMEQQLQGLLSEGFLVETPEEWFPHLPRFVRAVVVRLEKLRNARLSRDQAAMQDLVPWIEAYHRQAETNKAQGIHDEALVQFRWMLEEYRVSLFAQELGTSIKVSPQRLQKQWSQIRA